MENFSVVMICRNEGKVLGRCLDSLKGVDDIVILDTGSTDDTVKIAKERGCNVIEVGDMFKVEVRQENIDRFKAEFGMEPSFKPGDRVFDFASARNHALTFAKNDWCFQPDADEVVSWDLEKVMAELPGSDQLTYRFCYQHRPDGTCELEFSHCKFFRKSKVKWKGIIHEIHTPVEGQSPNPAKYVDHIYHHHWQEQKAERGNYLPGLELDVQRDPGNDRQLFYLAREYFYRGMHVSAVRMFEYALGKMWWKPEIGQAYIFKSRCHEALGQEKEAEECLHESLKHCDTRREPFWALGNFLESKGRLDEAVAYYMAATTVPFRPHGYMNEMELYTWKIHDKLAMLYSRMGAQALSKEQWLKALAFDDCPDHVLSNINWFYKCPRISIVVPTCRPEGFKRLKASIERHTVYKDYEIVEMPGEGTAVQKFNAGVEKATGDLIVFMADDTEATHGWLEKAFVTLQERLNGRGLVIFNDGHWHGTIANHFLVNKSIRLELDGNIWCEEYFHNSVDCELYCRLDAKRLIAYAENAKIIHHHHFCHTAGELADRKDEWNEKVEGWALHDRLLLPKRLEKLGLKEDAKKYMKWFLGFNYPNVPPSIDLRERLSAMDLMPIGLRVCNIGIGEGTSGIAQQLPAHHFDELVHVEPHLPYIEKDRGRTYSSKRVRHENVGFQDFGEDRLSGFDVVMMFDVLEHMPKADSLAFLDKVERHTDALVFIPIETEPRANTFGNHHQDHLSFWTEQDFKDRGYQTELLRDFHGPGNDALWAWRKRLAVPQGK